MHSTDIQQQTLCGVYKPYAECYSRYLSEVNMSPALR